MAKQKKERAQAVHWRGVLKLGICSLMAAGLLIGTWLNGCKKQARGGRPNVILITLDTTRADHLSCYGYHRKTSPNLDGLATESVFYTKTLATSSWTLPSHASLFTGKFPSSHGAKYDPNGPLRLGDAIKKRANAQRIFRVCGLAEDETTLAGILQTAGFATGAVVGGPWMKRIFGLDKGFDFYDDDQITSASGRPADQINESALKWIKKNREREFFLFLNYFDPHRPYEPPEGFIEKFLPEAAKLGGKLTIEEQIALYDTEIFYMDHHIGVLLRKLKDYNLYDNSLVAITADHGELFGEHGLFRHGQCLYQEEIHIPLMIKYPKGQVPPARIDSPVQLTDILPMILNHLEIGLPENIQGGTPPETGHPLFAEVYPSSKSLANGSDWRAIFDGNFKFFWNSKGKNLLFNLAEDPRESVNLVVQHPQRAARMLSELNQYLTKLPKPGKPSSEKKDVDPKTAEALKKLGYFDQ